MNTLFEMVSASGLTGEVHRLVSKIRTGISRNTVMLALKDERPSQDITPLRRHIRQVASELLEKNTLGERA